MMVGIVPTLASRALSDIAEPSSIPLFECLSIVSHTGLQRHALACGRYLVNVPVAAHVHDDSSVIWIVPVCHASAEYRGLQRVAT
jgi:hypothetical protein